LKKGLKRGQTRELRGGREPDQQEEENPITRRRETRSTGGGKPDQQEEGNPINRRRETRSTGGGKPDPQEEEEDSPLKKGRKPRCDN
jgi:hypothetical protein